MSMLKKYWLTQTEVGTLPIRYARTMSKSSFIETWVEVGRAKIIKKSQPVTIN
jgi:hypothetical protein